MIKLISVKKIYKTGAEDTEVLKDVSIEIDKGKYISITGPYYVG